MAITLNGGGFPAMLRRVSKRLSAAVRAEPVAVLREHSPPGWPSHAAMFGVEAATGPP